ncbi:MAG: hypothetical protein R3C11_16785 [Planctomycetaceae bacterium]
MCAGGSLAYSDGGARRTKNQPASRMRNFAWRCWKWPWRESMWTKINEMEIKRTGTTYTVDTLTELKEEDPTRDLFFMIKRGLAARFPDLAGTGTHR